MTSCADCSTRNPISRARSRGWEVERTHWPTFDSLRTSDEIKFVLADRPDFDWACRIIQDRGLETQVNALLFSPVHGELDPAELAAWILEERAPVTLQLQEHTLLWPGVERGI